MFFRFVDVNIGMKFSSTFSSLPVWLLPILVVVLNLPSTLNGLHLTGSFKPSNTFFLFLAKFGFQKTEVLNKDGTQGYIYGNITYHNPAISGQENVSHINHLMAWSVFCNVAVFRK
jgi:hypothetical protein